MDIAITAGLLVLSRCISAYNVVNRCPLFDEETWRNRGKEVCKKMVGQRYHCFKSINGAFVEMCIIPTGFSSRECPYFDPSSSSNFQFRKCNIIYGQCPLGGYYPSYYLYRYTACLHSPTTVVYSSSEYDEGMTKRTVSERKQLTTRFTFSVTATTENNGVTILKKLLETHNTQESATIFKSDIFKGILAFTGGMLIVSVCFVTYVIRRKKQMELRMTYSNAVAFKDNTENIYDDIAETLPVIQNSNTPSLEQSTYLEPQMGLHCHVDTPRRYMDVSEKDNTDMQMICDGEMETADNNTEDTEVKDTAPSLLGFL